MPVVSEIFEQSVTAIRDGKLIARPSRTDKEFHFQDWFKARLAELDHPFESGGRNSYPDFRMVEHTEGYELKGLAYPGGMPRSTATVRFQQACTTVGRFIMSSAGIRRSLMATPIQSSIWLSAMAIS
jgi:hypothetical protein